MKLFRCYSNPNEQTARYAARERRWMGPWRKKGGQGGPTIFAVAGVRASRRIVP